MKYTAVIFDLFGTLVDIFSRREYEQNITEMASILGAPYDAFYKIWLETGLRRSSGSFRTIEENLKHICRELKIKVSASQIEAARRARFDYVARALKPRKDAIETLSQLKADRYKIGLISNCSTEPPIIWPNTPFAPFFNVTVFSSVACILKPDPRIFQMAVKQLKVAPLQCLYIADGIGDELLTAANLGITPILIKATNEDKKDTLPGDERTTAFTGTVITSLKEVLNLVK
jgi:putative hydrolase of the HAD superfamily